MPQLFPLNSRKRFRQLLAFVVCSSVLILGGIYYNSFRHWEYAPTQPIEFSHRTHTQLGLDCCYCHPSASRSPQAGIPDANSCMACHRHIMPNSPRIIPLRKSADPTYPEYTGTPIAWIMVNTWEGHAKFSHQAHTLRGVGCTECHGNIADMDTVSTRQNLGMRWCIECHRNPAPSLCSLEAITWKDYSQEHTRKLYPSSDKPTIETLGETLKKRWKINPPINDCSACHY